MANRVRVQRVDRENSRAFYANVPAVLADAIGLQKGEAFVWTLEDKNTLVFTRDVKQAARKFKSRPR